MLLLVVMAFGIAAPVPSATEVELLELNHVYSWSREAVKDGGEPQRVINLSQWIIWEEYTPRHTDDTGMHVWCWRRRQKIEIVSRQGGVWKLYYKGKPIIAKDFRETWTQYDPEILDAQNFCKHFRRKRIEGWQR